MSTHANPFVSSNDGWMPLVVASWEVGQKIGTLEKWRVPTTCIWVEHTILLQYQAM